MGTYSVERLLHLSCSVCNGWWTIGDGDPEKTYTCPHCCSSQSFSHAPPIGSLAKSAKPNLIVHQVAFCLGVLAIYGWLIPIKRPYSIAVSFLSVVAFILIYVFAVIQSEKRI